MKITFTRALKLLLVVLFPGILFAQSNQDYSILLNSGKFVPAENGKNITKTSEIFKESQFGNRYYVLLQFLALPDEQVKQKLAASGIRLIDYIPNKAFTASVPSDFNLAQFRAFPLRSVFRLSTNQKTVPAVLAGSFPEHAIPMAGYADVTVITYEALPKAKIEKELNALKATVLEEMPMYRSFTIRVPQQNAARLVSLPFVQWVEPIDGPNVQENLLGRSLHRVTVLNDGFRNLKGDSVNVGIWDSGEVSPHLDFTPVASRRILMETSSPADHSTHVAGTIGGRGIINPKARGMAPNSKIYSYNFNGNVTTELFNAIGTLNLSVSSHSYGTSATCGLAGTSIAYSSTSRNTDINLNTYPSHLHVHSAGNSQTSCSGGWSTITGSGKSAKNNILVANITTTEGISGSSSFGPVADGRVKPEISALGTNVLSTYLPLNSYASTTGTSMATPGVSGSVALLVQRYKQLNSNTAPVSSLIKGAVCNTATDLGNPGPDYKFGYGRINALAAVKALEDNRYDVNSIATGATNNVTIAVPSGAIRLKVMLTWNDPAAATNANPALVNNLDLSVISASGTTLPWILNPNSPANPATRGVDNVSNIEQVTLDNPAAGTYTLRVNGAAVPMGPQQYSLTWTIDQPFIEVIFPNGGESFSPGTQETITWDNAGITGNQTVQYSVNNGSTWVTISSAVSAATTRYNWTVPAGLNTSTALVRVFSNSISDISDANFKILGTPTSLNASNGICAGALNFSWSAVTNATHYDIFKLDMNTGQWDILAANVAGTSYAASGLTPGASMWFTIAAKNATSGAVSEKALAINRTVPTTGSSASMGPISGWTSVCGNQNVTYSVAGSGTITAYTWSVPAGASIVSGQGTNSVVVNFGPSAVSGSVSVAGTGGACQVNPSSLAVSVGTSVTPPVSGGDQSVCANSSGSTVTATATVPGGQTVVWYSAATGGTIISNPTLSNPGTITYYAAAKVINGNCESTTRTAVTLTLKTATPATITANGTTDLCPGTSVTLTASAGNSYLWSNGATTQTITVSTTGNYSVTVTQANGCSNTSPATVVSVKQVPLADISASGVTTICEGNTVTLTASPGTAYLWSNGATSQSITVDKSGTYSVTVTLPNGCSSVSAATPVIVNPAPDAVVSANGPTTFCQGGSVMLTASSGSAYSWSNGATSSSITVNTPGNYHVTVFQPNGCSDTSPVTSVAVTPKPLVSLSAAPYTNLLPMLTTKLTATVPASAGPMEFTWFKNGNVIPGANTATLPVTVDELGDYSVAVSNRAGCSGTSNLVTIADSASVQVFIFPNPSNGKFQIRYHNPGGQVTENALTIYDAKGAKIKLQQNSVQVAYERMDVDLSRQSAGVYMVVLHDSQGKRIGSGRVVVFRP